MHVQMASSRISPAAWLVACFFFAWPAIARSSAIGMIHPNDSVAAKLHANVYEGYLLMALTSSAHLILLDNWLASLKQASPEWPHRCIISCLDKGLYTMVVEKRNVSALYMLDFLEAHIIKMYSLDNTTLRSFAGEKKYGKYENYAIVNRVKVAMVYTVVKYYDIRVISSDTDVVILNLNMTKYFDDVFRLQRYDMLFSEDYIFKQDLNRVCGGFFVFRRSDFSLRVMEVVINDTDYTAHDQIVFNQFLQSYERETPKCKEQAVLILPNYLFVNGQGLGRRIYESYNMRPWTVHANYLRGLSNKIKGLKDAGFWFVDPPPIRYSTTG